MEQNEQKPNKYAKAKVYKIVSDNTNKIYVGSSCQQLRKRLNEHIHMFRYHETNNIKTCKTSFEIIRLGNLDIVLLEDYPCERKEQLHARERYWIEKHSDIAVNKVIPTRTSQEYERMRSGTIKRKIKNRETRLKHRDKYIKKQRIRYSENKDAINAKRIVNCVCICGGKYKSDRHKTRHMRSMKHIDYMNNYTNNEMNNEMKRLTTMHENNIKAYKDFEANKSKYEYLLTLE